MSNNHPKQIYVLFGLILFVELTFLFHFFAGMRNFTSTYRSLGIIFSIIMAVLVVVPLVASAITEEKFRSLPSAEKQEKMKSKAFGIFAMLLIPVGVLFALNHGPFFFFYLQELIPLVAVPFLMLWVAVRYMIRASSPSIDSVSPINPLMRFVVRGMTIISLFSALYIPVAAVNVKTCETTPLKFLRIFPMYDISQAECLKGTQGAATDPLATCALLDEGQYQSNCYLDVAVSKLDASLCGKVYDTWPGDERQKYCEARVTYATAKSTGNFNLCDEITGDWQAESLKSSCFIEMKREIQQFAKINKDASVCPKLPYPGDISYCYNMVALLKHDTSICDLISNEHPSDISLKESCYIQAVSEKDFSNTTF